MRERLSCNAWVISILLQFYGYDHVFLDAWKEKKNGFDYPPQHPANYQAPVLCPFNHAKMLTPTTYSVSLLQLRPELGYN